MRTLETTALSRAFEIAADQVADGTAPWTIVGVADAEHVIGIRANPGAGAQAVDIDTVVLTASITKSLVATTMLQLVAEGRSVLTAPIEVVLERAVPTWPDAPDVPGMSPPAVTAWHLLSHTSGMPEIDLETLIATGATHADVVDQQLSAPLEAAPGSRFRYTTSTYDLIGELIAILDGRPYPGAIRARVLEPLEMADTTFDPRPAHGDRLVMPLASPAVGHPFPAPMAEAFTRLAAPGGGLWSTAPDLLRFGRAMLRGGELDGVRILPPVFTELMTREVTVDGIGAAEDPLVAAHYALGWGKPGVATPGSRAAFGHGGATGTRLWIDPDNDLVFVYLTGVWGFPTEPVDHVMQAVYAAVR